MGSFKVTCSLTSDVISEDDEVLLILLTARNRNDSLVCYNWDNYAPIPMLIEGKYNGYGGLDDAKLFNTTSQASEEVVGMMNKKFFEVLKNETVIDTRFSDNKIDTLSDLINARDWSFVRQNSKVSLLETLVRAADKILNKKEKAPGDDEIMEKLELMLPSLNLGAKTIDEARTLLEEMNDNPALTVKVPIQFFMIKKEVANHLLNNFGVNTDEDDENYYVKLQKRRHEPVNFVEQMDDLGFYTGTKDYAGNNRPVFSWHNLYEAIKIEKPGEKIKNQVEDYYAKQVWSFALINEYMNLLGKSWHPSMTVSDDIKYYGHNEAFEMQKQLLNIEMKKKPKP